MSILNNITDPAQVSANQIVTLVQQQFQQLNQSGMIKPTYSWNASVEETLVFETRLEWRHPPDLEEKQIMNPPHELSRSLVSLRMDHPDENKCAFIMMQFKQSQQRDQIVAAIKDTLAKNGLIGLRADDKEYHTDTFDNIRTYMHGCGFGIAVYDRIDSDEFNSNVSLEVGYMLGIRKQVCLLKEKTLLSLQADLVGKLYRGFDIQQISATIETELKKWLRDKGLCSLPIAGSSPTVP